MPGKCQETWEGYKKDDTFFPPVLQKYLKTMLASPIKLRGLDQSRVLAPAHMEN